MKRNKHKRIKVLSDDDDSDDEAANENDADVVANQIFGDDDEEDMGPADHDESSQQSAGGKGGGGEERNAYGDLDESEESGEPAAFRPIETNCTDVSFISWPLFLLLCLYLDFITNILIMMCSMSSHE